MVSCSSMVYESSPRRPRIPPTPQDFSYIPQHLGIQAYPQLHRTTQHLKILVFIHKNEDPFQAFKIPEHGYRWLLIEGKSPKVLKVWHFKKSQYKHMPEHFTPRGCLDKGSHCKNFKPNWPLEVTDIRQGKVQQCNGVMRQSNNSKSRSYDVVGKHRSNDSSDCREWGTWYILH